MKRTFTRSALRLFRWEGVIAASGLLFGGCSHFLEPEPVYAPPRPPVACLPLPGSDQAGPPGAVNVRAAFGAPTAHPVPVTPKNPTDPAGRVEGPAAVWPGEPRPIDLPTALRLADARNPAILVARERIREALARQQLAELAWLPDLNVRTNWLRHDGQIQRASGEVITVSRSSLFVGGGATLSLDLGDVLFTPLAAQQVTAARAAAATARTNERLLDVALAYLDLTETYAELQVNEDVLANARQLLKVTESHERGGTGAAADTARARTEVNRRERQRVNIQGRINAASVRLSALLLLPADSLLLPAEPALVPVALVPENVELATLLAQALKARPELAENQALLTAALQRWRAAKAAPLVPRLMLDYAAGGFGGGINSHFDDFSGRSDFSATVLWELQNLGLGNRAQTEQRQSQYTQVVFRQGGLEAEVAGQVATAFSVAFARKRELAAAESEITAASESYRLNEERVRRAPEQGRPIELLQAIQALAQARFDYLRTIADYNRAQFRLYTALGNPPLCAFGAVGGAPCAEAAPDVPAPPASLLPVPRTMPTGPSRP